MPGIEKVPVSLLILIRRIEYWNKQKSMTKCLAYQQFCESMIFELETIKDEIKRK